jgi:hypothetical protein
VPTPTAWWQVDLGSKKNISQIIIYNRTDCCANRLSNYQVSISNKADFSTHTYQQDFHVAPNPKKIIQLDAVWVILLLYQTPLVLPLTACDA